jgi:hypothetical protein
MVGTMMTDGVMFMNRVECGLPATVFQNDGNRRRPALRVPVPTLTWHYTGNFSPVFTKDVAAVVAAMKRLQRDALASGKSNEYNYVIFALADGTGVIAQYAGVFLAAHTKGNNPTSIGCQFHLGATAVDSHKQPLGYQPMPDAMVAAYRFLRDRILRPFGVINAATAETFHKDMPKAKTVCPGDSVVGRRAEMLLPHAG